MRNPPVNAEAGDRGKIVQAREPGAGRCVRPVPPAAVRPAPSGRSMPALAASPQIETTVSSCASATLRDRLRAATAEAHAALDRCLQAFDLTTRAGYGRFLAANAAALLPLERALEDAGVRDVLPA